jgi:hypothetical protein
VGGARKTIQRPRLKPQVLGQVIVAARDLLSLISGPARGRLVERQAETRGQSFRRRQRVGALALESAFRRELQQVVKALPVGLCKLG